MANYLLLGFLLLLAYALNNGEAFNIPPRTSYSTFAISPGTVPLSPTFNMDTLNSSYFPKDFVFGAATASYQIEGAWNVSGKGQSNWDHFTHTYPEKINNPSNGDVACDSYHRYKEDISIMKHMGLKAYRFSMSWPRMLPRGKLSGGVNEAGIKFYNDLINECLANGLTPYVTLFHWDLPQALEEEYGGFLSPLIVNDFRDYAELCFKRFGDRVTHWITINEAWTYSTAGYVNGNFPPGHCSSWVNPNCTGGNSGTEPYLVAHQLLLSHAAAVQLYRQKYQKSQKGVIGMANNGHWFVPYNSTSQLDRRAASRAMDFMLGWFATPITYGEYPNSMRLLVGKRLPKFTEEQSKMLKGSYDFLGLNFYTAFYAKHSPPPNKVHLSWTTDSWAYLTAERDGKPIGEPSGSIWLHIYPRGLREILLYIKRTYNNPEIYITENGISEVNNASLSLKDALVDNQRIRYYYEHLAVLHLAMLDGVKVKAYFLWSILDNMEWDIGYAVRFGTVFIDFWGGLTRIPKHSVKWFTNFLT